MKGIVLAGGFGRRLEPLTRVTNKHLLPVYDRPMVYYAVEQLVGAGIEEIMIITGGNHAGEFLRLLGNGATFGLKHLDYAYQEQAGGIAQALGLAEHFAAGGPVAVILGDNIFERSLAPIVENGKLARIVEKPADPPSRFAVTGFYLYDTRVFDFVKQLKPSKRSELEITDVNNQYLQLGELSHDAVEGYWADCGESIDMLLRASNLVAKHGANKR